MFEHFKQTALAYRERRGIASGTLLEKGIVTAISAGTAGSIAAVITTPVDVVKTRIMLSAGSGDGRSTRDKQQALKQAGLGGKDAKAEVEGAQKNARSGRAGSFAVGKEIFRTEGIKGLFRGGALRGAWTVLGSGLYLGVYESGRTYLEGRREDKVGLD